MGVESTLDSLEKSSPERFIDIVILLGGLDLRPEGYDRISRKFENVATGLPNRLDQEFHIPVQNLAKELLPFLPLLVKFFR